MRRSHFSFALHVCAMLALAGCAEPIAKEPAPVQQPTSSAGGKPEDMPSPETRPSDVKMIPSDPEAATEPAKQKRLVFLTNTNSPFWDAARAGLQEVSISAILTGCRIG